MTLVCNACDEGSTKEPLVPVDGTQEEEQPLCIPTSCEALRWSCGAPDDGCGIPLDCGVCEHGDHCAQGVCEGIRFEGGLVDVGAGRVERIDMRVAPSTGLPALVYTDKSVAFESATTLYYAAFDGDQWQREEVVSNSGRTGQCASLAFGPDATPHVSYSDVDGFSVHHAVRTASGWHNALVEKAGFTTYHTGVFVDAEGGVHLCYHHPELKGIRYARLQGASWQTTTLATGGTGFFTCRFAQSYQQPLLLSYHSQNVPGPTFARLEGGTWQRESIEERGPYHGDHDFAIAADGSLHIAYVRSMTELRYARRSPGEPSWSIEDVENEQIFGIRLALDSSGAAHLFYASYQGEQRVYRYARRVAGQWDFHDIAERSNMYAQDIALTITPEDQVFLAFPELASGGLMVLHSVF